MRKLGICSQLPYYFTIFNKTYYKIYSPESFYATFKLKRKFVK